MLADTRALSVCLSVSIPLSQPFSLSGDMSPRRAQFLGVARLRARVPPDAPRARVTLDTPRARVLPDNLRARVPPDISRSRVTPDIQGYPSKS